MRSVAKVSLLWESMHLNATYDVMPTGLTMPMQVHVVQCCMAVDLLYRAMMSLTHNGALAAKLGMSHKATIMTACKAQKEV